MIVFKIIVLHGQSDSLQIKRLESTIDTLQHQIDELMNYELDIKKLSDHINSLKAEIGVVSRDNDAIIKQFDQLRNNLDIVVKNNDSLEDLIKTNSQLIDNTNEEFGLRLKISEKLAKERMSEFDSALSIKTIFGIIGILLILILLVLAYLLLRKRQESDKTKIEKIISETRKSLEEEGIGLDSKLIDILETQLKLSHHQAVLNIESSDDEIDHSLALKVADEIVRMQRNIHRMDENTKGLKPLLKGIERIRNNFAANGYEMIDLLNIEYDDRMNIDVIDFKEDVKLPVGKKIITRVIKPQVNYNDVMIQRAQVDVSHN